MDIGGSAIWNAGLGVVGILLAMVGALIVRTLNRLEATMEKFAEGTLEHEKRIARLEGYREGFEDGRRKWEHPVVK